MKLAGHEHFFLPSVPAKSDLPRCTWSAESRPATKSRNSPAIQGSKITERLPPGSFLAPKRKTLRAEASAAVLLKFRRALLLSNCMAEPICISPFSSQRADKPMLAEL